jgi:hypothetical protein
LRSHSAWVSIPFLLFHFSPCVLRPFWCGLRLRTVLCSCFAYAYISINNTISSWLLSLRMAFYIPTLTSLAT